MWRMDSVVTCTDGLRFSCIGAFVDVLQTVDVHASCRVAVQARRAAPTTTTTRQKDCYDSCLSHLTVYAIGYVSPASRLIIFDDVLKEFTSKNTDN